MMQKNNCLVNMNWNNFLKKEYKESYFIRLINFLNKEYSNYYCFPKKNEILSALKYCPIKILKVVILGQDPYYKKNQADGLCFSVPVGTTIPPSLKNIFIEVHHCFPEKKIPQNGSLIRWAKQGVLLLNSILTVREGTAGSHKKKGWEIFTDHIIQYLSKKKKNIVFLLWGIEAKKKYHLIKSVNNQHFILTTSHPSPLSVRMGFFGSKHFLKTNNFLVKIGKSKIIW
ncbi:uracil-DNA glycosylase [Blattabacterium cuenoti]|uniref:uracil-DNA glycosylase n=1 Tax=Blattabacterium cuenoti TaxID=1653831 RepID=UPI00163B6C06|nr:uracil-DNA glycosylase [Blattabacterium cuenoti]